MDDEAGERSVNRALNEKVIHARALQLIFQSVLQKTTLVSVRWFLSLQVGLLS